MIKYILFSLLCLGICSCSIDKTSYIEYINDPDNGLSKVYSSDDWTYTLQFRSAEFMAMIEAGKNNLNKTEFNQIIEEYNDLEYFLLTIRNKSTSQVQSNLTEHLSFDFKTQVTLWTDVDEKMPDLYHFEGGLSSFGEYRCLLGFEKQTNIDRNIEIKKFGTDQNIQFTITQSAIIQIPELSI